MKNSHCSHIFIDASQAQVGYLILNKTHVGVLDGTIEIGNGDADCFRLPASSLTLLVYRFSIVLS